LQKYANLLKEATHQVNANGEKCASRFSNSGKNMHKNYAIKSSFVYEINLLMNTIFLSKTLMVEVTVEYFFTDVCGTQ
jgi:hypothetical protein